jgi:hypothetical protein
MIAPWLGSVYRLVKRAVKNAANREFLSSLNPLGRVSGLVGSNPTPAACSGKRPWASPDRVSPSDKVLAARADRGVEAGAYSSPHPGREVRKRGAVAPFRTQPRPPLPALFPPGFHADKEGVDTRGARELAKRLADEERRRTGATDDGPRADTGDVAGAVEHLQREDEAATGHVLFVSRASGYGLVQREGVVPEAGSEVTLSDWAEGRYRVSKVGPSPLPGDPRRCAFLEHLPSRLP